MSAEPRKNTAAHSRELFTNPARSAIQAADFGRAGENARFMIEVAAFRG